MKQKVHQVQRKQIDNHKLCSKCLPLARTQARKGVGHWSTASSISNCSKLHHTCSRRCCSTSISWTLVSYTRCWMTDQAYLQRAFTPVPRRVKVIKFIKIFQSYDHRCTATIFYGSQCRIFSDEVDKKSKWRKLFHYTKWSYIEASIKLVDIFSEVRSVHKSVDIPQYQTVFSLLAVNQRPVVVRLCKKHLQQ